MTQTTTVTPPLTPADPPPREAIEAVNTEDKLVPVVESIRYRKRAQQAEQQLESMRAELAALREQYGESQETVTALERRAKIDALLSEADSIDFGAARLLTEAAVSEMDEPDVALAVEDLRRHKPYLFRNDDAVAVSLAAHLPDDGQGDQQQAAQDARASGDRRDLLRYLRLRRTS